MSDCRHSLLTLCLAMLAAVGATSGGASTLTVIDPNCTGFALGGSPPSQTLDCVGGSGSIANPKSLSIDDKFCNVFAISGVAPNQTLTCSASSYPVLASAASSKAHGAAGTFNLNLSLVPTNPSVEPRLGPTQNIVMTFDRPVVAASAQVTEGIATAGAPVFSGNSVITPLVAVANQQYVTLSLSGVTAASGGSTGTASVRIGFLAGDVSQNRLVSVADTAAVNAQLTQAVTLSNFVFDINASGSLTTTDKVIANNNLTKALPPP